MAQLLTQTQLRISKKKKQHTFSLQILTFVVIPLFRHSLLLEVANHQIIPWQLHPHVFRGVVKTICPSSKGASERERTGDTGDAE